MLPPRRTTQYVGLVLVALLAAALSLAAVIQGRSSPSTRGEPVPAPSTISAPLTPSPSGTPAAAESPSATSSPSPTSTPSATLTRVVVVGDATSISASSDGWVERAARELKWQVDNLSAPGMGFTKVANRCSGRCTTFNGLVPTIAEAKPSIVVVFGGMADGDYPIGPESREFFAAVRKALPKATVVALSPVMTKDGQLGWIRLHRNNVKAAVAAVDGRFVDLGQPSLGSRGLSSRAQEQIARKVVSALGKRS